MAMTRAEFVRGMLATVAGSATGLLCGCGGRRDGGNPEPEGSTDDKVVLVDRTDASAPWSVSDVTAGGDEGRQDGFVVVQEYVPDVMADVRYYGTYNFVGEHIDGYDEPIVILATEAADALRRASDDAVSRGYRLKVYDGYRPQRAVEHFCRWVDADGESMKPFFYPDIDKASAFSLGYVARQSGHSRGSTVDLTLFDMASGRDVDMGGTFDFFGELSHPDYTGISSDQYGNRMMLRDIMVSAGFSPTTTEWWHFTLDGEPYPDTYFDFPVAYSSLADGRG